MTFFQSNQMSTNIQLAQLTKQCLQPTSVVVVGKGSRSLLMLITGWKGAELSLSLGPGQRQATIGFENTK